MEAVRIKDGFMWVGYHATCLEANISGGTVSCVYLIVSDDECCLIDAGMNKPLACRIGEFIRTVGCALRYIILTHDHFDHVANTGVLKKRHGGVVMAHPLDIPMIENPLLLFSDEGKEHFPQWLPQELRECINMSPETWGDYQRLIRENICFPQQVDRSIEGGQVLRVGSLELRVLHTPGHSPGSISILNEDTGSLYIGDLARGPGRPYPIGDVKSWEESLLRVKNHTASFLGIGHAPPLRGRGRVRRFLLEKLIDLFDRERRLLEALSENYALTVEELTDILFPNQMRHREYPNRDFTTYCHLTRLKQDGMIAQTAKGGKTLWTIATHNVDRE